MEINKTKRLNNLQYYPQIKKKTQIYWHHTAGTNAQGAIDWWNQTPENVGTAYVIDRDGTIYEVFDPKCWGYHLGIKGDNDNCEKNSIGIEIVSAGQLYSESGKFIFYPLFPNKSAAKEIPKEDVWEMSSTWRGFKYYHKYSDAQINSLIWLTKKLAQEFNIKIQSPEKFYEYNPKVISEEIGGLWSHSTVREDKNDIIPHPDFIKRISEEFSQVKAGVGKIDPKRK